MKKPINWTKFTRRIYIKSPMKQVYDAWAVPARVEEWFLQKALYTSAQGKKRKSGERYQKGDRFEWKWHNWAFTEKGRVLEANGKDIIKFDFAGGYVTVTLTRERGMVHITLVQDGIAIDDKSKMSIFCGCSVGWSFWLTNLKAWLENGITLNETRPLKHDGFEVVNC